MFYDQQKSTRTRITCEKEAVSFAKMDGDGSMWPILNFSLV